ncbi:uracil-DNA glycosylase family protein [Afifella pfennigii]|uniref:uracil-DNA glycosylase family protein n=1 Tax=Afifella pfennigii TaxID=209897 RepID=UPI00047B153E|nr:uracil-DNA glycosylase family protein [Afifella pfennigii]
MSAWAPARALRPDLAERAEDLARRVRACRICVERPEKTPLPHPPNPILRISSTARLCIASQAAGTRAHATTTPFNDPSGERLRAWMGVSCEEFYDERRIAIVPMGFCFPGQDEKGGDLPPRRECAPAWREAVFAAMPQIELVLAVGQYAMAWHLGALRRPSLTETVADWRHILEASGPPALLPLPHPSWRNNAWLKRHPFFEAELLPELRKRVRAILDVQS